MIKYFDVDIDVSVGVSINDSTESYDSVFRFRCRRFLFFYQYIPLFVLADSVIGRTICIIASAMKSLIYPLLGGGWWRGIYRSAYMYT